MSDDFTLFVGLDYHTQSVQICGLDHTGNQHFNHRCTNDWQAIACRVGEGVVVQAAIQAAPGAADLAEELPQFAGWSVHLAQAQYVVKLKQ